MPFFFSERGGHAYNNYYNYMPTMNFRHCGRDRILLLLTLCTRVPKIRLLHDASAARKPKIRLRGLPIINN